MKLDTDPFLKHREHNTERRDIEEGIGVEATHHEASGNQGSGTNRLFKTLLVALPIAFLVLFLLEGDYFQKMIGIQTNVTLDELLQMIHM